MILDSLKRPAAVWFVEAPPCGFTLNDESASEIVTAGGKILRKDSRNALRLASAAWTVVVQVVAARCSHEIATFASGIGSAERSDHCDVWARAAGQAVGFAL
jgi:hypothetical protein